MKPILCCFLFAVALLIPPMRSTQTVVKAGDNCYFDENGNTVCDPPDPYDPCLANPDACQ